MTERGLQKVTTVTPKRRRTWQPTFLATFSRTGNVLASCQAAGISRMQAYRTRASNVGFAEAWAAAEEDAIDFLEAVARQRAIGGSDALLMFLLKAHWASKYRDSGRDAPPGPPDG